MRTRLDHRVWRIFGVQCSSKYLLELKIRYEAFLYNLFFLSFLSLCFIYLYILYFFCLCLYIQRVRKFFFLKCFFLILFSFIQTIMSYLSILKTAPSKAIFINYSMINIRRNGILNCKVKRSRKRIAEKI